MDYADSENASEGMNRISSVFTRRILGNSRQIHKKLKLSELPSICRICAICLICERTVRVIGSGIG